MKRHLVFIVAVALALVSLLPGMSAARLSANHNQTLLRD
jgi:hypothetical protein